MLVAKAAGKGDLFTASLGPDFTIPTHSFLADFTDNTLLEEQSLDPHAVSMREAEC